MIGGVKGNQLRDNSAAGDMAGGNIYKTINHAPEVSALRKKVEQLKEESVRDEEFGSYIKQLTHYLNPINPNDQRDLSAKLTESGREDEIFEAEELKENFTKTLMRSSLSEQAQLTYVHILACIKTNYDGQVKPLIKTGGSLVDIEASILGVIEKIYSDLVDTALEYDQRNIKGMLYFLAGNCHIEWKY